MSNDNKPELTDDEINLKIARFCGEPCYESHDWMEKNGGYHYSCRRCGEEVCLSQKDKFSKVCYGTDNNYVNNLESIHSAENYLNGDQKLMYSKYLLEIANEIGSKWLEGKEGIALTFALAHLTSRQKAAAFIKVIAEE